MAIEIEMEMKGAAAAQLFFGRKAVFSSSSSSEKRAAISNWPQATTTSAAQTLAVEKNRKQKVQKCRQISFSSIVSQQRKKEGEKDENAQVHI